MLTNLNVCSIIDVMEQPDLLGRLNILSNEMDIEPDAETSLPPIEARLIETGRPHVAHHRTQFHVYSLIHVYD